jgi:hypothetical protein
MTNPMGTADFFALEAGECLDRLALLVNGQGAPPADEFLRLSRVLRGSALMAGQGQIARAAASLEALARAHRDQPRSWDAATREQLAQAVEEFRLLVRRSREWGEQDTERALRLGKSLETLLGRQPTEVWDGSRQTKQGELHTGVRAFVAREGALIASALDRAARSLRASPGDREPLYNVIRRMQSLRGLAELSELPPLPEILDGIELAIGDLTRLYAPPAGVDEVMDAAARALTQISKDVAEQGRPQPESEEARRFTELLLRAFAVERDVVPIESLYFAADQEPVTHPVSQPQFAAPQPLGPLELVSQGEHLCQSAELIGSASSTIERDLRLYRLLGTLRSAATPSSDPVGSALGIFARSAQEALAAGVAHHAVQGLVTRLKEAGELLRTVGETGDRMLISRRLLDVAYRLDGLRSPAEVLDEAVPIESLLLPAEPEVVPIESLAPQVEAPAKPAAPIEEAGGLERSLITYDRLLREGGPTTASFEAALRESPPPAAEQSAVPIATLCYTGQAALERANLVRQQIAAELTRNADLESLQPLLQELLDLVPLALAES